MSIVPPYWTCSDPLAVVPFGLCVWVGARTSHIGRRIVFGFAQAAILLYIYTMWFIRGIGPRTDVSDAYWFWIYFTSAYVTLFTFVSSCLHACFPHEIDPGRCAQCGYDLRGLPERRCPECGTPFLPDQLPDNPPAPELRLDRMRPMNPQEGAISDGTGESSLDEPDNGRR